MQGGGQRRSGGRRDQQMHEAHEAEVAARERMTARGGADAHIVRKGLS